MEVLGRDRGSGVARERTEAETGEDGIERRDRPPSAVRLGSFLARDGSDGAAVWVDADTPHAGVVFGKRGTGKSYTLGVLAEGLAAAPGVAPVIVDPMGVFTGVTNDGGRVVAPAVRPAAIPPSVWPDLVGLDPTSGPGSLLWRSVADAVSDGADAVDDGADAVGDGPDAGRCPSLEAIGARVAAADAPDRTRRAVCNHLQLAASWGVFDVKAPPMSALVRDGDPVVIDLAGVPERAAGAVVRAVARGLYDARLAGVIAQLPWLLVDEAHAFFGGVADAALRTLLTRGRAPGVSLVCATQRPSALPDVAVSQADLLIAHRLTAGPDVDALAAAEATYLTGDLAARLPSGTGEALVVDDASETAHLVRIRERRTPHGGGSPQASDAAGG
jgi:hypothetical protein